MATRDELSLLDTGLLNAALVGRQARTLWLTGLHRRTAVKADAKVLSGVNLVAALSPLGDQTYTFSAVRTHLDAAAGIAGTLGVTPRRASLWTRSSRSWEDFIAEVALVLNRVATVAAAGGSEAAPIPILAMPAGTSDDVEGAYDLTVIAPELLADDPNVPADILAKAARFAYDVRFEVSPLKGPSFRAKVFDVGEEVGTLEFTISIGPDGSVKHDVEVIGSSKAPCEAAAEACSDPDRLAVYFESGHVLNSGQLYLPQFRDLPFRNWSWESFVGFEIEDEKPLAGRTVLFDQIGLKKSLFCWTIKNWPVPSDGRTCWLTCDDGALEVADFVGLAVGGRQRPLLSLIHVKGSHSTAPQRGLSTSAYEVVVSQAVKNLRSLERRNLRDVLQNGAANSTKRFAWTNGQRDNDRTAMLAALLKLGADYDREVVIIQPSAHMSAYTRKLAPTTGKKPAWFYRRAQLDTLLLGAESDCFAAGATFRVIADKG